MGNAGNARENLSRFAGIDRMVQQLLLATSLSQLHRRRSAGPVVLAFYQVYTRQQKYGAYQKRNDRFPFGDGQPQDWFVGKKCDTGKKKHADAQNC
jgi:hypothetical protein